MGKNNMRGEYFPEDIYIRISGKKKTPILEIYRGHCESPRQNPKHIDFVASTPIGEGILGGRLNLDSTLKTLIKIVKNGNYQINFD